MSPGWTQFGWLRGVDLNHQPLGFEIFSTGNFSELVGVVASGVALKNALQ